VYLFWGCWAFWGRTFFLGRDVFKPDRSMKSGWFVKVMGFLVKNGGKILHFRRIIGMAVPDQFCSPLTGFGQPIFFRNFADITYCNIWLW
jgi:hypothetical protein